MTGRPEGKIGIGQKLGGWVYNLIFQAGWPRWVLLAVALLLCLLAVLALSSGTDYREDPSALVPRSAEVYAETRNLEALLKRVGGWKLWGKEDGPIAEDSWTQLHRDLADIIGDQVEGLGRRQPLMWLSTADRAAYCVVPADQPAAKAKSGEAGKTDDKAAPAAASAVEPAGGETWALLLHVPDPANVLSELGVEKNLSLAKSGDGLYTLTGKGEGKLYFAVVGPWLMLSSGEKLPKFAQESMNKPAFSLARSDLLAPWRRSLGVRGLFNPAFRADLVKDSVYAKVAGWMAPDVRINFTGRLNDSGGVDMHYNAGKLTDRIGGGGLWPLILALLTLLGIVALAVILAIACSVVGYSGWLKGLAWKAGIRPVSSPAKVESSAAFKADVGAAEALDKEGGDKVLTQQPNISAGIDEGAEPESREADRGSEEPAKDGETKA